MTKCEVVKKLIKHYSKTISCKNCFLGEECGREFQSIITCEKKMESAFVKLEK